MAQKISRKIGEGKQKKVLSLVLCVAMMLSVMVVGAGAAFSDQSKIKNTEAVDACTALNIIGGYPDGSFKPEGNITRAEATKMICVALNGGKEPAVSTNATPTFSDVRGNANAAWAEGYIESCVAQGIVSGVGAGKFAPNGNVTGVQLAKMLLVALGYKSDLEGFTGNAWATNVNVIATQRGLYKNLEKMDTAAALTRDNAAQMIWNALQATEVEYSYTLDGSNGNLSSKAQVVDKTHRESGTDVDSTLLWDKYDCYVYEGILIGSGEYGEKAGKDKIGLEIQKFEGTSLTEPYSKDTFKYAKDITNLVGQYVKVLANKNDEAYGVYAIASENTVVTTTFDKVKQDGTGKIKIDGTSYKYESNAVVKNVVKPAPSTELKISEIGNEIAAGDVITFVSHDGDNKFDVAYVNPMVKFGKVTYVGSDKVTAGGVSYDEDDVIPSGLKKGDYVAVYKDLYTGDNKLVKADEVTGKITATKDNAKEVKIGDNWYKVGNTTPNNPFADAVIATGDVNQIKKTGDRFTIFSINGIIYYADKESSGSTDTAYVLAATGTMNSDGDYQVKMLFADGTTKLVATDHAYNGASGEGDNLKEKLVTYEVNSDNLYELKEVKNEADYKAGGDSVVTLTKFNKSEKKVVTSSPATNYRVSSTAVVYVQYKDGTKTKQKVMTGSELNALGSDFGTTGTAVIDGGLATIVLLKADGYLPGAKATQLYGYITSDVVSEEADGGVKSQSFTVWTSENKSIDVKMKGNTKVAKGDIISFDLTSDNYIEGVKSTGEDAGQSDKLDIVYGAIKDFKMGDYVTFYNKTGTANIDYEMDDDVKYLFLNTDDTEGVADDTLSKATEASDSSASAKKYYNNAVYVLEGTGANAKIVMIACDVVNQYWKGQTTSVAE